MNTRFISVGTVASIWPASAYLLGGPRSSVANNVSGNVCEDDRSPCRHQRCCRFRLSTSESRHEAVKLCEIVCFVFCRKANRTLVTSFHGPRHGLLACSIYRPNAHCPRHNGPIANIKPRCSSACKYRGFGAMNWSPGSGTWFMRFRKLGAEFAMCLIQRRGERWQFSMPILRGCPINSRVANIPAVLLSLLGLLMFVCAVPQKTIVHNSEASSDIAHSLVSQMCLWNVRECARAGAPLAFWFRHRAECAACRPGEESMRGVPLVWDASDGGTGTVETAADGR